MDDFEVFVNFVHDGKIFVTYPQEDPEDYGMFFRVEHPREAAELLHLFVYPKACTAPGNEEPYTTHDLGELFDFRVLFPVVAVSFKIEPTALPPARFEEKWPDYVQALPGASAELCAGYRMDFEGRLQAALSSSVDGPGSDYCFFDLLLVPRRNDISTLYLRELLTGHLPLRQALKAAFADSGSLEELVQALKGVKLLLPPRYHQQIRLAAEQQAMRGCLLYMAGQVAAEPGNFHNKVESNWHLAHILQAMLDPSAQDS